MEEKFTIAHISDTHLGKNQYKSDMRRQDYTDAFEEAVNKMIEMEDEIDVVIHTGDLFDSPNPDVKSITECIEIFSMLEDKDMEILSIVGNHERKRDSQWLDIVNKFEEVTRLDKEPISYQGVNIYGIDAIRKHSWNTTDISLEGDNDDFNIVCMHELIHPPVPEHMADYNAEDVLDELDLDVDILALGDYHESVSKIYDGTLITYPGSTEKTSRDESENHSFNIYRIENNDYQSEKINLESTRRFIQKEFSMSKGQGISVLKKQLKSYDEYFEDNPVIVITLTGEDTGFTKSEVEKVVKRMGAGLVKVVDKRGISNIPEGKVEDIDSTKIETEIDDIISDMSISEEMKRIETVIRDEETPNNKVRERVNNIIKGEKDESK